jgi:hypothetical protein
MGDSRTCCIAHRPMKVNRLFFRSKAPLETYSPNMAKRSFTPVGNGADSRNGIRFAHVSNDLRRKGDVNLEEHIHSSGKPCYSAV